MRLLSTTTENILCFDKFRAKFLLHDATATYSGNRKLYECHICICYFESICLLTDTVSIFEELNPREQSIDAHATWFNLKTCII